MGRGLRNQLLFLSGDFRKWCLIFVFTFVLLGLESKAQVYLGAGYVEAYLSDQPAEDASGLMISVAKSIAVGETKLAFQPSMNVGLLLSNIDLEYSQAFSTTLGLSALMSYRLIRFNRFTLIPFAGPFVSWAGGFRASGLVSAPTNKSEIHTGMEVGVAVDIEIAEGFNIKVVPKSIQFGTQSFLQSMIVVYIPIAQ